MILKDQLDNQFILKKTPKRIICLVPSITELLVDLGLFNSIVGITKFCVHPKSLRLNKQIVGGTKAIKVDKIKSLNPDFIICNKEENSKEIFSECSKIATTYVSNINSIEDILDLIYIFGVIFSCIEKSNLISDEINRSLLNFKKFINNKQKKKVAYFIWKDPWMVAGSKTFIHHLLNLNHFENVFSSVNRYPEIEIENLLNFSDLDFIFLSSEPYPFKEKHIEEIESKKIKAKVVIVNGEYFSWYGSRLLKAFDYFKNLQISINK